jgi:hypothetical protein
MSLVYQIGASLNSFRQMVTAKQAWVGFLILFLVMLLVLAAVVYWQHVTGMTALNLLADVPDFVTHGC